MTNTERIKAVFFGMLTLMGCAALFNGAFFCTTETTQFISALFAAVTLTIGTWGLMNEKK